jgi:AraC-like DNA-binding protein/mannose-6-phosphate isomerase-like protein (cupin superfamily)
MTAAVSKAAHQPFSSYKFNMPKRNATNWSIRTYGPSLGSHAHEQFQILWGLEGNLELEVEGKGSRVGAGQGLVITPGDKHDFESLHGSRCLILDAPDLGWSSRKSLPQFAKASNLLAQYIVEAIEQKIPFDAGQAAFLFAQSWGPTSQLTRVRRDIDWQGLSLWVNDHLSRPLSVGDLAEKACLSESQFRARCVEALGCSPMQWIRRLRIERARCLRLQGISVAEVAVLTGYDSPSALTAALRRLRS